MGCRDVACFNDMITAAAFGRHCSSMSLQLLQVQSVCASVKPYCVQCNHSLFTHK